MAHTVRNQENVAPGSLAWSRWLLARVLWETNTDRGRAVEYLKYSRNVFAGMGDGAKSELDDIDAWLQQNAIDLSSIDE